MVVVQLHNIIVRIKGQFSHARAEMLFGYGQGLNGPRIGHTGRSMGIV